MKKFILKNAKKIMNEEVNSLETVYTKDISAFRKAGNFLKKALIFIKKSLRSALSGFVALFKSYKQNCKPISSKVCFRDEKINYPSQYTYSCMDCLKYR